ncbi:DNA translocase FtsK 4TM domain-containing protein [Candidatus Wolfebacteria bacterium]|nr:DNA translocase FtsK 4TM domain-containing protein [Candidatus Wolfebacteria bacterium]
MARKKNKNNKIKESQPERETNEFVEPRLYHETKKSIGALVFFAGAVLLALARFGSAGPLGGFFYEWLIYFFGLGYYLLPIVFLILAGLLLTSRRQKIYQITFWGALLFVLSSLGLIDVLLPEKGGLVGVTVGLVESPLGYVASLLVLGVLMAISLLVTFNLPIKLHWLDRFAEEKEEIEETIEEVVAQAEIEENVRDAAESISAEAAAVVESSKKEEKPKAASARVKLSFKNYVAPPLDLLKSSVEKPGAGDLRANANIIKRTLESFGIPVEMSEINIGPKFTRYTLKPAEGVKLSRIMALNQDLSLALAAHPIRIEAPIPGKSLVGIEVPNKASAIVRLGSLIAYPEFNASGPLGFVLGRDVSGEPIFVDIDKMPHLLIAGASGSGKSIAIHSLLTSLIYKNSPDTLRLIMIDPKRVELTIYEGIPHLISPVVVQSKKALGVLRWLIEEMDRRYELLMKAGSRDIQSYNKKKNNSESLSYILIVIDELADLMATYGREVEGSVVRLAQMARATGIHLVVSTQRPSVEVLTGLIKANITSRIALQLPSQVDSRTVLDASGAEKLLGGGDMLFISSEISKPKRIQGAYISEEEVHRVADFIRENNAGLAGEEGDAFGNGEPSLSDQPQISDDVLDEYLKDEDDDELLEEAIEVVRQAQKASASLLQRRLKVGYARAARLLDIMEEKGIVGPGEGAKPREVYLEKIPNS